MYGDNKEAIYSIIMTILIVNPTLHSPMDIIKPNYSKNSNSINTNFTFPYGYY